MTTEPARASKKARTSTPNIDTVNAHLRFLSGRTFAWDRGAPARPPATTGRSVSDLASRSPAKAAPRREPQTTRESPANTLPEECEDAADAVPPEKDNSTSQTRPLIVPSPSEPRSQAERTQDRPVSKTVSKTVSDLASQSPAAPAAPAPSTTTEQNNSTSTSSPPNARESAGREPPKPPQSNTRDTAGTEPQEPPSSDTHDRRVEIASQEQEQAPRQERSTSTTKPASPNAPAGAEIELQEEQEREEPIIVADAMHASPEEPHEAFSFMAAPTTFARKSVDNVATARTLPSPAPSDDSPVLGQGRTRTRPAVRAQTQASTPTITHRTRPSAVTAPNQVMYNGYPPQIQMPQNRASPHAQRWTQSVHARPSSVHILPSSPSTQTPHSPSLAEPGQPQVSIVYTASRLPVPQLLARLDAQREQLTRNGVLQGTDSGRLTLLRDAVVRHDWFYQMLSQVFCLHSISPDMLPHVLHQVPPQSYSIIGALLCTNDKVNQSLLKFFSNFPEPIMTIYSDTSNAREVYETRLRSIAVFLQKLPVHWDNLVTQCKSMLAPPLVQDLVGVLNMQSEVLQTTAFRAITRMFWGVEDNAGMKVIEEVHVIDQQSYYRHGWRRDQQEKILAYRMLKYVYQQWQSYRQKYGPGDHLNNFTMPFQVRECFTNFPRSCAPAGAQSPAQPFQQAQQTHQPNRNRQVVHQAPHEAQQHAQLSPSLQSQFQTQDQLHHRRQQQGLQDQRGRPVISDMARVAPYSHPGRNGLDIASMPMSSPVRTVAPRGSLTPGGIIIKRLYPAANSGQRAQPTHPNPDISALHQAHLRSPKLLPKVASGAAKSDLYRHVVGYALTPSRVENSSPVNVMTFKMSSTIMARVAKSTKSAVPGEPPIRTVDESSLMYRLRCCAIPPDGFNDEASWVISDNYWPDGMTFSLNDTQLETRRKLHHGRYLPIDVTSVVRQDKNDLRVTINRKDGAMIKARYAVAIEAIGVISHAAIKKNIKRMSIEDSVSAIKKSLTSPDKSNDDIAVTSSSVVIQLTDPYSLSDLVVTPARGSACLHRNCFDLNIFLSYRTRTEPSAPTVVDCWKCPICLGDVRPQMLVLDEFIVSVREDLLKRGLTETKTIQVQADGTWKPKQEEKTGVRSASLEREIQQAKKRSAPPIEIIELD